MIEYSSSYYHVGRQEVFPGPAFSLKGSRTFSLSYHSIENHRDMTQFSDRYEILKPLGRGGTAWVFLARDRKLKKYWAVKILEKKGPGEKSREAAGRAMHEARILSRLDLPGAVRIADLIEDGGKLCIVTDYIEGQDLKTYIYRYGRLSEKQAAAWLLELCGTLSRLHGMRPPVIFCDLKPENIMVKTDGTLVLVDFGSAWQSEYAACGEKIPRTGTYGYAAPELYKEGGSPDPRTDIYGLGALGAFLLTGLHPGRICTSKAREKKELYGFGKIGRVIRRCMETEPEKRYGSCEILKEILQRIAEE